MFTLVLIIVLLQWSLQFLFPTITSNSTNCLSEPSPSQWLNRADNGSLPYFSWRSLFLFKSDIKPPYWYSTFHILSFLFLSISILLLGRFSISSFKYSSKFFFHFSLLSILFYALNDFISPFLKVSYFISVQRFPFMVSSASCIFSWVIFSL